MEEGRKLEERGRQTPYRVKEIAEAFGVATKTIYGEIARGELPALLIGGTFRVEVRDLDAYRERCRARAVRSAVKAVAA